MRFKKKTRIKSENRFLTLRRQLPKRDKEIYWDNPRWSKDVSLFFLKSNTELWCANKTLCFFEIELDTQSRIQTLFKLRAKCD